MRSSTFGSSLPILGYAFFVATVFLLVRGYQFNTDDQAEHLPQVYQMLDPQLYPTDYFVNVSNSIFTVRYYYEQVVLLVAQTVGLEWGLFVLTLLCIALTAYSFAAMAQELFANAWSVLLAPVLVLLVFYDFTVGGNHIMYGSFISSTVAKSIAAFGLLRSVQGRQLMAGFFLGAATLFQPLVGLQLFLLLAGVELVFRRNMAGSVRFILAYVPLAAFILVPTFMRQFAPSMEYDHDLYYAVLYRFRNHHHYLPSLFPATHYIKFLGLLLLGMLSYGLTRPLDRWLYPGMVLLGSMGMLIYWLAVEHLGLPELGKVQWFKTTVWLSALSAIMVAGLLGERISAYHPLGRWKKMVLRGSLVAAGLLLAIMLNSVYLPEPFRYRYMVGNRAYTDLEKMHLWIAQHTPVDAVVLVPPENNAFACQAKRNMPVHFQAIVHEPFFMLPWYEDFRIIYGVGLDNLDGVDARAQAAELYCTRNYTGDHRHIDYRLDDVECCAFIGQLGPAVHKEGRWVLTEFHSEE